ncbi:hypothetical protein AB3K25_04320 [Leuconostoc sp. MS02]|uniref:Uncharacterized protein n=1 Tax=Leuconostoc aquikimchii TaxID=3236804 RepID=A0ABV3S643_9LACO
MKKGIKKAITSPTKETVITDHKHPYYGFCYTHFTMNNQHHAEFMINNENIAYINSLSTPDKPFLILDRQTNTAQITPIFRDFLNEREAKK